MSLTLGAALGIGAALGLVGGAANVIGQNAAYDKQIKGSQELWDYQWNKANSPQAQVRNLTKAGLNPAAMFGNQSPVMNSGGSMAMLTPPNYNLGVGTQSLSDLAQYIAAGAEAKKKGVEIPNIEEDTRSKVLDNDAKEFQNMLMREFGLDKAAAEVSMAWKQVQLAEDSHDMNLKEQAMKDWSIAKEKAMSECEETRRDILKKEFENKDTQIKLENEQRRASIGEIRSRSALNAASAENQKTQAEVNRENRRLQAAIADVEESTKTEKINSLLEKYKADGELSDADYEEAKLRLSRLGDITDHRDNAWFSAVDNFTEWLKSKVKIFGK